MKVFGRLPSAEKFIQFVRFIICIVYYYLLLKVQVAITPLAPNNLRMPIYRDLAAPCNILSQKSLIMFSLKFPVHCTFFSEDFQRHEKPDPLIEAMGAFTSIKHDPVVTWQNYAQPHDE